MNQLYLNVLILFINQMATKLSSPVVAHGIFSSVVLILIASAQVITDNCPGLISWGYVFFKRGSSL